MALTPTVQELAAYYIGIDKMYNTLKYNHFNNCRIFMFIKKFVLI